MSAPITVDVDRMLPVSEANAKGVSKLASEAEQGLETLLLRGGKPVAWVVGMDKYRAIVNSQQVQQDLLLVIRSLTRRLGEGGDTVSFDEVLGEHGLTREQLG